MNEMIKAKDVRFHFREIVNRVKKGDTFTVIYRSTPAFNITPISDFPECRNAKTGQDSLFHAEPVGESKDGFIALNHDQDIYS